jgi:hypothetical protein
MKKSVLVFFLILRTLGAAADDAPPQRYESWGVCPFECCTYREWTADAEVLVHAQRSEQSPVLFRLHHGESFDALDGVVITENPAAIKVDQAVYDGYVEGNDKPQLSLNPGDVVYMLTPLGEGAYLFWYKGKVYKAGTVQLQANPGVEGKGMTLTWWKQVRNKAGQIGWTSSDRFRGADDCG